ncbi:uncharacterized protein VDAG_09195 [Verticillium dahliae VdLs.17]|uniref:Uncharacterized protein n=1 Tax=Verticillium dahliae (strain VdLs.17 / ATCC MYA-4575 / FGSC 10137) TaxID=498257 RepID=G2XFS1_VERDV|nr:uncharacterized protein VDAG_09195 [Verticillium dahliae VdLs.17]EGY18669.1 hypothetical protein VDAG_09195 [Verticillium dahliae VdLs.17]
MTKAIEPASTPGVFRPDSLVHHTYLLEASERLYRLCCKVERPTKNAEHCCRGSAYEIAYMREHQQLQRALAANRALVQQLSQARAKAAYYEELWTATGASRQRQRFVARHGCGNRNAPARLVSPHVSYQPDTCTSSVQHGKVDSMDSAQVWMRGGDGRYVLVPVYVTMVTG